MRTIARNIVGGFIFSSDKKLLLGKTAVYTDQWVVPGGGIDEGETKLQALRREMLEETGIDINDAKVEAMKINLTGKSKKILRDTGERVMVEMTFYNFLINLPQAADEVRMAAADDFTDARWFSIDELKGLPLSPPTIESLKKLGHL